MKWRYLRSAVGGDGEHGNVAVVFALVLSALLTCIVGAVDFAVWLRARSVVRASVDAAVLRGARELQLNPTDTSAAVLAAEAFYRESAVQRLDLRNDTIRFEVIDGGAGLAARGGVSVLTPFAGRMGLPPVSILEATQGDAARGVVTVGLNARQSLEIAVVVDVSRATAGGLLDMLKPPLKAFVDTVVWPPAGSYRARLAIVPYADAVAPGTLLASVTDIVPVRGFFDLASGTRSRLLASTCVGERDGADALNDAAPATGDFLPRLYSPTGTCSNDNTVVPLSADAAAIKASLDALHAGSADATAGHVGAAWGWYVLSPHWSAVLGSAAEPQPYSALSIPAGGSGSVRKIVVLIGAAPLSSQTCNASAALSIPYSALPDRSSPVVASAAGACQSPRGSSERQTDVMCAAMRASGIWIFALALASPASQPLQRCASSPDSFYEASGPLGIELALHDVALKITSTYLSR